MTDTFISYKPGQPISSNSQTELILDTLDAPVFEPHSGQAPQPLRVLSENVQQALFKLAVKRRPLDRARESPARGLANRRLDSRRQSRADSRVVDRFHQRAADRIRDHRFAHVQHLGKLGTLERVVDAEEPKNPSQSL